MPEPPITARDAGTTHPFPRAELKGQSNDPMLSFRIDENLMGIFDFRIHPQPLKLARKVNMSRLALRQLNSLPPGMRSPAFALPLIQLAPLGMRRASHIPTIAQPSFWKSLVPKPLRSSAAKGKKQTSKEWNPATFFIAIFLLIGSMSIQMISLKKDFAAFTRQTDVRIGLLREVVEKLQRGEEVDVEKVLGTGDPEREIEWQDGMCYASPFPNDGTGNTHKRPLSAQ